MKILIVDDAFDQQTLEVLGVRGGRTLAVRAVDAGVAAPTWAQVLVAGADSGPTSPRVTDGVEFIFVDEGLIRAVPGGLWYFQATSRGGVGENGSSIDFFAGNSARADGGTIRVRGGASGGPGTTGGSLEYQPGNSSGGTDGEWRVYDAQGILVQRIGTGGVAWGAGALALSPPVVGARGGNAALASLLTTLDAMGFITDNTTA
jgi:hypothetical protein